MPPRKQRQASAKRPTPTAPFMTAADLPIQVEAIDQTTVPVRAIINNAELRANAQSILSLIKDTRPKNTVSAYEPKQEEFQQFCKRKGYLDADTVTEDKLLLFLVEEVVNRPLRSRSRKANGDVPFSETRLAWRSVRTYVTALTDLDRFADLRRRYRARSLEELLERAAAARDD